MKRAAPPRSATWLFGLVLPQRDREMLLGDLEEEYALLASTLPPRKASRWYWNQVIRSAAPLLWANIRRGWWLKTLGAALAGYLAVVVLVMVGDIVMSKLLSAGKQVYALVSLATGFPAMMLGGYLAAWIRPRAAVTLAVITAVMGMVSLAVTGDAAPLWYQIALIVMGPLASLAGGRIRIRGKAGSRI
jgi:hypothetical protein